MNRHYYRAELSASDLGQWASLLPPTGVELVRLLGADAALRLFNVWPGVQFLVPKGPCANSGGVRRWAQLCEVLGESATLVLSRELGGVGLNVPTLARLRQERRNHGIRIAFDFLTSSNGLDVGLSKARAVHELCLLYAPMSCRQIETILDRPGVELTPQPELFESL